MTIRARVLLVDDDEEMRKTLAEQLRLHEEFETVGAEDGAAALELSLHERFDVILLDVSLPDMDGRDVCRLIRRRGAHTPVILLTALNSDADQILGLDSGANDFVSKPFRIGVLLARMRAQLRQHESSTDATLVIGPYNFQPGARLLIHRDTRKEIPLSDKESAILRYLYRAGDVAVGCDAMYDDIWGHSAPLATHTLQSHIYRLRQKIEAEPGNPRILVSEAGGYRVVRRPPVGKLAKL